jgi:hypothetical protein
MLRRLRGLQQYGHLQYFSALSYDEVKARGFNPVPSTSNRRELYGMGPLDRFVDGIMADVMINGEPVGFEILENAIRCNVPCVLVDNDVPALLKAEIIAYTCTHKELIAIEATVEAAYRRLCQLVAPRTRARNTLRFDLWGPLPEPLTVAPITY